MKTENKKWQIAFIVFLIFILCVFILAYLGLIPTELRHIPWYDSIGHFVLLGILAYLLYRATNRKRIKTIPLAPFIISLFAIIEESAQLLSSNRTFSLTDLFWGLLGIWMFWLIDLKLRRMKFKPPFLIRVIPKKQIILIVGIIIIPLALFWLLYPKQKSSQPTQPKIVFEPLTSYDSRVYIFDEITPTDKISWLNDNEYIKSHYSSDVDDVNSTLYSEPGLVLTNTNDESLHPFCVGDYDNVYGLELYHTGFFIKDSSGNYRNFYSETYDWFWYVYPLVWDGDTFYYALQRGMVGMYGMPYFIVYEQNLQNNQKRELARNVGQFLFDKKWLVYVKDERSIVLYDFKNNIEIAITEIPQDYISDSVLTTRFEKIPAFSRAFS